MIRIVRSRDGIELITSMIRIRTSSTQPPKCAISAPYTVPMMSLIAVATIAMISDARAPTQTLEKRSRPRLSVPNQYFDDTPWFFSAIFMDT